ncbi:MAG: late competence development ComFB family protein, partial [Halanaerobiaceae bacterium]|nr:late competence development ComFB family protein [Halanaerobiaceae bacterium]
MKIDLNSVKSKLNNHTETVVLEVMEDLLKKSEIKDICTCKECLLDIASYALNNLPAR